MPRCRFSVRSSGFSVLEVLLVTSIVATLAAVSIPVTAGALDELRTSMAAQHGRFCTRSMSGRWLRRTWTTPAKRS